MTAPATIRKADLARAADVAKAKGCAIEITVGHMKIRVIPDIHEVDQQPYRPMDLPDDVRF